MALTLKTNNKWRDLVYRHDVPDNVLTSEFDYLDEEEGADGFFKYRGRWYHISGFVRIQHVPELATWHGYALDSAFSGIVIKISRDGERVMCGTYYT